MHLLLWLLASAVWGVGCGGSSPLPENSASGDAATSPLAGTDGAEELPDSRQGPSGPIPPVESIVFPPVPEPAAQPQLRPRDARPQHDPEQARELGIELYRSRRLLLWTDVPAMHVERLPELVDALYEELERYFGPLPPEPGGGDYQLSGFLMRDPERFRQAGMLPRELPQFEHGRHLGREFWLFDQQHDYYRAHLVLHEATHCFMTTMPGTLPPIWYMEGMAEYFATHRRTAAGEIRFGVLPENVADYAGFGGVQLIQRELQEDRALGVREVLQLGSVEFSQSKTIPYAWSWYLCQFLNRHPRYHERFRELRNWLSDPRFVQELAARLEPEAVQLEAEWGLAVRSLELGYDPALAELQLVELSSLPEGAERVMPVQANLGWQSTGLLLEPQTTYEISAEGRVIVAETSRPWDSTADGITIRYASGQPMGRLLAVVVPVDWEQRGEIWERPIRGIGRHGRVSAQTDGTGLLLLRVNDRWGELADNQGAFLVSLRRLAAE